MIRAQILIRGSMCDVYAGVRSENSDGTISNYWDQRLANERILLQEQSSDIEESMQGQERGGRMVGFALPESEIGASDGIVVLSGLHAGKRFHVVDASVRGTGYGADSSAHLELELEVAKEVIG